VSIDTSAKNGSPIFNRLDMSKRGILLINLGSPDSPAVPDVRRYLREFLMDERVIDTAWPVRFALVNFLIIPRRAHQSVEAYASIWTKEGSPLVVTSKKVCAELQKRIPIPIEVAMRYQSPSISEAIYNLAHQGVSDVLVIPLFPHWAMSSFETAAERARQIAFEQAPQMKITVATPFFDDPDYIAALVETAKPHLTGRIDHLLFSFHGLPERHLHKADPSGHHPIDKAICCDESDPAHKTCYRGQCLKTVQTFARAAGLAENRYSVAFQSRLGREPWMRPYTDVELARLAKSGVKRLAVMCPAFVADCLETLEEIGMRGREIFLDNGGEEFTLIPCLNENPRWIQTLERMITDFTSELSAAPHPIPASAPQSAGVLAQ
jgi:protoporphyrin/coproporphyrin ferrochelatase